METPYLMASQQWLLLYQIEQGLKTHQDSNIHSSS